MRSLKLFAMLGALNVVAWILPQEASGQQAAVSFQLFYDNLSPYGMWVDYPDYGYVWIPNADPEFSPYATAGYWVFTDEGWTWVSDYPWGWAAFHYGRWDYDDYYGWFWIPDNEWGPAWVSWRRSPGYYGWAPLRPGVSITLAFGREYQERNERWIFVGDGDFGRPDISRHYVNRSNNVTIINNSTVIVNTRKDDKRNATYITGPDRDDVQRVTHTSVSPVAIRENDRPGQHLSNGELQIYRPQVQKRGDNGQNPAPSKVMKLNDVRPATERNGGNRQQQSPMPNPPNRVQPGQPQNINPSDSRGKQQQPRAVNPPNRVQPGQPQNINPSDSREKQQQPRMVNPPNKNQSPQSRDAKTANSKEKKKQPQVITPSKNKDKSQPKPNEDKKDRRDQGSQK
jgi:hypothetical protein